MKCCLKWVPYPVCLVYVSCSSSRAHIIYISIPGECLLCRSEEIEIKIASRREVVIWKGWEVRVEHEHVASDVSFPWTWLSSGWICNNNEKIHERSSHVVAAVYGTC